MKDGKVAYVLVEICLKIFKYDISSVTYIRNNYYK